MNDNETQELLDRYSKGNVSPQERAWVDRWYIEQASHRKLSDDQSFEHLNDEIWTGTLERAGLSKNKKSYTLLYSSITAAAILLIAFGIYLFNIPLKTGDVKHQQIVQDIKPGGNKAILTLANGKKIILNSSPSGKVAEQSGITITKNSDGEIIYSITDPGTPDTDSKLAYNTIETPKGGQYQLRLPDGTKVWLNSASSLKYPVHFSKKERVVELTGEGYFEVAHLQDKPFRVVADGQSLEVLGTHFDVNAYKDEKVIRTTLLSGSVKVNNSGSSVVLKPGQESVLTGSHFKVGKADTDLAIAWRNGYFMFKNASLQELMRQLSRWYDIEVEYVGTVPPLLFNGKVYRNTSLAQTLELLSFSKLKFKLEEKKIRLLFPQ